MVKELTIFEKEKDVSKIYPFPQKAMINIVIENDGEGKNIPD
jgi:hypothetical protein